MNKKCKKCKQTLPLDSFYKHYTNKDKRNNLCCNCIQEKKDIKNFGLPKVNIFKILGRKCSLCGKNENLCIHHKDGNGRDKKNPNNIITNLIVLCSSCHAKTHLCGGYGFVSNENEKKTLLISKYKILIKKHYDKYLYYKTLFNNTKA